MRIIIKLDENRQILKIKKDKNLCNDQKSCHEMWPQVEWSVILKYFSLSVTTHECWWVHLVLSRLQSHIVLCPVWVGVHHSKPCHAGEQKPSFQCLCQDESGHMLMVAVTSVHVMYRYTQHHQYFYSHEQQQHFLNSSSNNKILPRPGSDSNIVLHRNCWRKITIRKLRLKNILSSNNFLDDRDQMPVILSAAVLLLLSES